MFGQCPKAFIIETSADKSQLYSNLQDITKQHYMKLNSQINRCD